MFKNIIYFNREVQMKKTAGIFILAAGILTGSVVQAGEYENCMAQAPGDSDITKCNNAETARVMRSLQSRYNSLASNKYFTQWNDKTLASSQNFQMLLRQWVDYRDKYCSLYGYTFSQGQGTITEVQKSQCMLDLTNRFAKDVEAIIRIYNDMAVTKR